MHAAMDLRVREQHAMCDHFPSTKLSLLTKGPTDLCHLIMLWEDALYFDLQSKTSTQIASVLSRLV